MKICAVIVSYNIGSQLINCVNSIKNQVNEVVIVDNGSTQATIDILRALELDSNITVFYNLENMGIAGGLNIGVKYALNKGYNWVITLDHDSEATPNMMEKMIAAYNRLKSLGDAGKIGIVAPLDYDVNAGIYRKYRVSKHKGSLIVNTAISSGSLINSAVFRDIGLFNEDLFIYYVDDDFCLRARKSGYEIIIVPDAVLLHREGQQQAKKLLGKTVYFSNYSPTANYYIFRNGIYIIRKHGLYYRYMAYLVVRRIVWDLLSILLYSKQKQQDYEHALKGLFHGLIGKYGRLQFD